MAPTFEELWNTCSQEELRIFLATNPEGVSNAYIAQHKGKKSKGPRKKFDMSKVEFINAIRRVTIGVIVPKSRETRREKEIKPTMLKKETQ